jgi:ubiquinone/menaquinone biosynthesis C-methylase UbiE
VDVDKGSASVEFVPVGGGGEDVFIEKQSLIKFHIFTEFKRELSAGHNLSRIIKALNIRPGMDILDIGAGTGIFSFRFAEALKGSGRVFATEIDPEMISYMEDKIREAGSNNIFPVLVTPNGLDSFYKERTFDIIFLCETYQCIQEAEGYFLSLSSSLKDTGRLYIINAVNTPDAFGETEFGDFKQVAGAFSSMGNDFPIFRRLSQETRDFIRGWKGEDIPSDIRIRITQEFNGMLSDRWLFNDLMDHYSKEEITMGETGGCVPKQFSALPYNIRLYKWFLVPLDLAGLFNRDKRLTDYGHYKDIMYMFNKRLLVEALGVSRQPDMQVLKGETISTLKAAGYEFVRSYDFLEEYYFLEFKKKL